MNVVCDLIPDGFLLRFRGKYLNCQEFWLFDAFNGLVAARCGFVLEMELQVSIHCVATSCLSCSRSFLSCSNVFINVRM